LIAVRVTGVGPVRLLAVTAIPAGMEAIWSCAVRFQFDRLRRRKAAVVGRGQRELDFRRIVVIGSNQLT
jgi:hypothetical protein